MASHRFRVGQVVVFLPSKLGSALPPGRHYKVLKLLPHDGITFSYRVKTMSEMTDRIASEADLELLSTQSTVQSPGKR